MADGDLLNMIRSGLCIGLCLALGAALTRGIAVAVYRLWFHPLSRFPGPPLARWSNLYGFYHAWKGDVHMDMWKCHQKYGDHVRYAPNRLLVNTSTGLRDIYGHHAPVQKSGAYRAMVHRAPNILTSVDKKTHGHRRRILAQGLSDASLRRYEPAIKTHVGRLCRQLRAPGRGWSDAMNLGEWCSYFTFDVMTHVVFGEHYRLLEDAKHRHVVHAIEDSNIRTGALVQAHEMTAWRIDRWLFRESIAGRDRFLAFVSRLIRRRMEVAPLKRTDVFTCLLNAKDPETDEGLSPAELGAESTTMIVAGSDTTSTALAATLFYLGRNVGSYQAAVAEVRSRFATPEDVHFGPELNSCSYLRACLDESMRMSPPTGGALWREVTGGGMTIDGYRIPAGCDVGTGIYAIHHNEAYFPDAFAFRPQRWVEAETDGAAADSGTTEVSSARAAFVPFSVGPRSCIGKGLAVSELMLSLAVLLRSFDLR